MINKLIATLSIILLSTALSGCGYMLKAAYEQSRILIQRRDIKHVIADDKTPQEERTKLQLISDVRNFSKELGLTPKRSFTYYTHLDRDVVSWIVVASKKDSFNLKTWWFPIVGTVPYKGFFDKEEALQLGKELQEEGYEISIRGALAYSTLGWFNDPVLTPLLKRDELSIIETVLHEIFHSTVWKENDVQWNESAANFFAVNAAVEYARKKRPDLLESAKTSLANELVISELILSLYQSLESVYNDQLLSFEEKLAKKEDLFAGFRSQLLQKIPDSKILPVPNNADLMQLKLYLSNFKEMVAANYASDLEKFKAAVAKEQAQ